MLERETGSKHLQAAVVGSGCYVLKVPLKGSLKFLKGIYKGSIRGFRI